MFGTTNLQHEWSVSYSEDINTLGHVTDYPLANHIASYERSSNHEQMMCHHFHAFSRPLAMLTNFGKVFWQQWQEIQNTPFYHDYHVKGSFLVLLSE